MKEGGGCRILFRIMRHSGSMPLGPPPLYAARTGKLWPMAFPFDPKKATEVAALFLRNEGGSINVMKLVKLIYLLDRESIRKRGIPVVGGIYLSMKNGPVTSEVLDLINSGFLWHCNTTWPTFISDRADHLVALDKDPGHDNLSEFELALLQDVYKAFGFMDQWGLRDWCHQHCGEWTPLDQGRERISLGKLAEEVGQDADQIEADAAEHSFIEHLFSS